MDGTASPVAALIAQLTIEEQDAWQAYHSHKLNAFALYRDHTGTNLSALYQMWEQKLEELQKLKEARNAKH